MGKGLPGGRRQAGNIDYRTEPCSSLLPDRPRARRVAMAPRCLLKRSAVGPGARDIGPLRQAHSGRRRRRRRRRPRHPAAARAAAVCGAKLASCPCATMATIGMRLLATAALLPTFSAVDNGVGLTPPMGCAPPPVRSAPTSSRALLMSWLHVAGAALLYCCDAGGGTGRRSMRTFRRTSWRI
jgi:hypothetical protein